MDCKITKIISLAILFFGIFGLAKSSEAATLYVSSNGSGSCSIDSPCSLSYALQTKCAAGDMIILSSGNYNDTVINLNNPSRHNNLTITTTDAVKSALGTFNRGIPSGTDNRPYFPALLTGGNPATGVTIASGVSGVTIEYMQFRGNANPRSDDPYLYIVGIFNENTTIQYCKIWNGGNPIQFRNPAGPKTLRQCYISNAGTNSSPGDTHMLAFCGSHSGSDDCGGTNAQPPSSWADKTLIDNNTFAGTCGGDIIQFSTATHGATTYEAYVEISNNDFTASSDEQMIDTKGAKHIKIHDNNFIGTTGADGEYLDNIIQFTYDSYPLPNNADDYWYIYNNYFHAAGGVSYGFINPTKSDYMYIWNNIFYNSLKKCMNASWVGENSTLWLVNTMGHFQFVHNTMIDNNVVCSKVKYAGVGVGSVNGVVRNNIFYNNNSADGDSGALSTADGSSAVVDHNFLYPDTPSPNPCPSGACELGTSHVTASNSQVVNAAGGDFRLSSGSVCKTAGTPISSSDINFTPNIDKAGNARSVSTPSLGAYEYPGGSPPPDTTAPIAPVGLKVI